MKIPHRVSAAIKAGCIHLLCSLLVAALAGGLVFGLWYPFPYRELSGGRELFLLIVSVDVVCGPLLTLVLFNPAKPRAELWRDLGLVVMIQLGALGYGLWTVWQARPLFLVQEVDRFKVVAAPDLRGASTAGLPAVLQPGWFSGPVTVAIREPKDANEGQTVLFESLQGGRDYAERPEFYIPYEGRLRSSRWRGRSPLKCFSTNTNPQRGVAETLAAQPGHDSTSNGCTCRLLPDRTGSRYSMVRVRFKGSYLETASDA